MKMTKKVFSAIALAAVVAATAVPVTRVEAAVTPIASYNFENGTGMTSTGFGTDPTVVQDAERGNVLKLADGESSKYIGKQQDSSLGDYDQKIIQGSPSSLKFSNPFAGKSLSGATFSFWIKVPDDTAANSAAGIIGFVSGSKTVVHPDKLSGDPDKQKLDDAHGPYVFGITCAYCNPVGITKNPMVYFAGLHHNTYQLDDSLGSAPFIGVGGKWQYMTVTMNNSYGTVYIDGNKIELDEYKNKRWNDGEVNNGAAGNVGQTKFLEFLAWSDTVAYVGYTGVSPTKEIYIDDLTFYDSELSASDVAALYQDAKSGKTATASTTSNGSSADSAAAKKAAEEAAAAAAAAEAAAVEANKNLTNAVIASVDVKGMPASATKSVTGIFRGESKYTSVQTALNGVILKNGYRLSDFVAMDISFNGTQPEAVATLIMDVPSGYDTNNLVVTRINDDGTVSILKHSIENGKIIAKTNHFSTYAIANLEVGTPGSASANLPKTGAVAGGVVAGIGAVSALGGAVLLKRRKEEE